MSNMHFKDARIKEFIVNEDKVEKITGYATVFGNVDSHGDIIERGAFKDTIDNIHRRKINLYSSHSMNARDLLGSLIRLEEDDIGLFFEAEISIADSAQDIAQKALEGHLNEVSIGFFIKDQELIKNEDGTVIRHIKEIELIEISLVSRASNPLARILTVKSEETIMSEEEEKKELVGEKGPEFIMPVAEDKATEELKALKHEISLLKDAISKPIKKTPRIVELPEEKKEMNDKHPVEAFYDYVVKGDLTEYEYHKEAGLEQKALASNNLADGGVLVPEMLMERIFLKRDQINRAQSRVTRLDVSGPVNLADYEFAETHTAVGENASSTIDDIANAFGKDRLDAQDFASIIKISRRLDRRNAVGVLQTFFIDRYAVTHSNNVEQHIIKGTGVNQPLGASTLLRDLTFNEVTVTAAAAYANVDYDDIVDCIMKLEEQYRNENTIMLVSKDMLTRIMKLKDSNNLPIWNRPVAAGLPATLIGYPIFESPVLDADGDAANDVGFLIGDWGQYILAEEEGFRVEVLRELYAATRQIGLQMTSSYDGLPVDKNAFAQIVME